MANLEVGQTSREAGPHQDGAGSDPVELAVVAATALHESPPAPADTYHVFAVSEPNGVLQHRFLTEKPLSVLGSLYEAFYTARPAAAPEPTPPD
jgi:hypothetical protein